MNDCIPFSIIITINKHIYYYEDQKLLMKSFIGFTILLPFPKHNPIIIATPSLDMYDRKWSIYNHPHPIVIVYGLITCQKGIQIMMSVGETLYTNRVIEVVRIAARLIFGMHVKLRSVPKDMQTNCTCKKKMCAH